MMSLGAFCVPRLYVFKAIVFMFYRLEAFMITSLKLKNFKSFREAVVPFGPLTLLVGTNASGKSNVREALQFLHGCALGYSLIEVIDEKYQAGTKIWQGPRGGIHDIAFHGEKSFELVTSFGNFDSENIQPTAELAMAVDVRNHKEPKILSQTLRAADGEVDLVKNTPTSRLALPSPAGAEQGEISKSQDKVLRDLVAMRFLDLSPHVMRQASHPAQLNLGDRGENLSSVLMSICEDARRKSSLLEWLDELTPMDVRDLDFKEDLNGRVLAYLVDSRGTKTSAVSASDGTLRFLAIMAALLGETSERFYFFEEIDNGIHPSRLYVLLDVLEQATRYFGCQIAATTHNPFVLTLLSDRARRDAVLLYRDEHEPATEAVRIYDLPDAERVLESQDLGHLYASGWLEDIMAFSRPDE